MLNLLCSLCQSQVEEGCVLSVEAGERTDPRLRTRLLLLDPGLGYSVSVPV